MAIDPTKAVPEETVRPDGLTSYSALKAHLLNRPGPILPPAPSAPCPAIAHAISSLLLHPALETSLHILNHDLPSAHFLVRHMEAPPAYESMMLHGILHRIEGDYNNARAWYRDVQESDVFRAVWGNAELGTQEMLEFVQRIEILRKEDKGHGGPDKIDLLQKKSLDEITGVIRFCEEKFGVGEYRDAAQFWSKSEKSPAQARDMIVGGEGWRKF